MNNIINTKIVASDYSEAIEKTSETYNFKPVFNATQAFRAAQKKEGFSLQEFCESYLVKQHQTDPGCGAYVILEPPVKDTKLNPTRVVKNKKEGRSVKNKAFEIYDQETGRVYDTLKTTIEGDAKFFPTRAASFKRAQEIVKQYKISVSIREIAISDVPDIGQVNYAPSAGTKDGTFIVFGVPNI